MKHHDIRTLGMFFNNLRHLRGICGCNYGDCEERNPGRDRKKCKNRHDGECDLRDEGVEGFLPEIGLPAQAVGRPTPFGEEELVRMQIWTTSGYLVFE